MQPEQDENTRAGEDRNGHEQHKSDAITTDDGLDQAIQRAIAQHDLEQQQLEQQQQQQQQGRADTALKMDAGPADLGLRALHRRASAGDVFTGEIGEVGEVSEVDAGDADNTASPAGRALDGGLGVGSMPGLPLLDAAQEKQHLQMIADELKRAATDTLAASELALRQHAGANPGAGGFASAAASEHVPAGSLAASDMSAETSRLELSRTASAETFLGPFAPRSEPPEDDIVALRRVGGNQAHTSSPNGDSRFRDQGSNPTETFSPRYETASSMKASPGSPLEKTADTRHIPANSELLATNSAVAAYNALSSQVPPTALLANAHLAALPLPIVPTSYMPARIQLLVSTLAVLDNLATQLLRVFAAGPYQKIIDLASSPDTAPGAAFRDLTSLFEFTKRLYSEEDPFLTVEHLAPGIWKEGEKTPAMFRSREQTIELTLRKVNLATFLAATLGTIEVGFFHLNESFLNVFCPANDLDPANSMSNMSANNTNLQSGAGCAIGEKCGKILKPQASLYLDLKTQAYISAIEAGERSREEILEDILPSNLDRVLQERRSTKVLSPTEMDFVHRCNSRKEMLLNYPQHQNLNEEYEWFDFLKDLFEFVLKNMGFLLWGKKGKPAPNRSSRAASLQGSAAAQASSTPHSDELLREIQGHTPQELPSERTDGKGLDDITAALLPSEIQEQQIHLRINPAVNSRGPSRRPWTRQEEKALRHAMELKGTQWLVILELFGQGGRINESLKNRTQVQLKDKARNWKMFFLKSGLAVPSYLQKVTGDLDRDDKLRAKLARNKKTAAAPVPTVNKRDGSPTDASEDIDDELRKKRRVG